jgi:hypothetical protein
MKRIIFIISLSIFVASPVFATTIIPIQLKPSLFENISTKIQICKLDVFCYFKKNLGTTISTITGTETVSYALKTTTNNNFTALNNGKVETSTTTMYLITSLPNLATAPNLATIGTITTGIWNATAIPVNKGGTGSTSPSLYQVMLGNGSNGLTVASSTGTTGQYLVSNGTGAYPSWQTSAIDQTLDYNLTGSKVRIKNLSASSTAANPITLNGLDYSTPSVRAASSTVLTENGAGVLTWIAPNPTVLLNDGTINSAQFATTTLMIPAGTMGVNDSLEITMITNIINGSGSVKAQLIQIGTGSASTTVAAIFGNAITSKINTTIFNNNSLSAQGFVSSQGDNSVPFSVFGGLATLNTANQFYISFSNAQSGAAVTGITGLRVLLYRK